MEIAMSIYVLDNYKVQAAVEYVKKAKRTWSGNAMHQMEQWFLDMPMNELTALNPQQNVTWCVGLEHQGVSGYVGALPNLGRSFRKFFHMCGTLKCQVVDHVKQNVGWT